MKNERMDELEEMALAALKAMPGTDLVVGAGGVIYRVTDMVGLTQITPLEIVDSMAAAQSALESLYRALRDEPRRTRRASRPDDDGGDEGYEA